MRYEQRKVMREDKKREVKLPYIARSRQSVHLLIFCGHDSVGGTPRFSLLSLALQGRLLFPESLHVTVASSKTAVLSGYS